MAASREKIAIVAGARTPVGRFGGAFKDIPAHELGAAATVEALRRSGIAPDHVGVVVIGNIGQVAGDAYISRRIALSAGLDVNTPAFTVNRLCAVGSAGDLVSCAGAAVGWDRCRCGRRRREHDADAVLRLQRTVQ